MANCQWSIFQRKKRLKEGAIHYNSWLPFFNLTIHNHPRMASKSVKEIRVFKLAFEQAMELFNISKTFPWKEIYSLTDQVRRSSRSVCICLLEAYQKRSTLPILYLKFLIAIWKTPKLQAGWIFLMLAAIYRKLYTKSLSKETRRSAAC